jgi:hypothetical protein
MTAIIEKKELKSGIIREYKLLKNFIDIDLNEKIIDTIIEQIAENIQNSENLSSYEKSKNFYDNYQIKKKLKQEKNRVLSSIISHKGSFL